MVFREISDILVQLYARLFVISREADITKERIQKILSSGANVVLLSGGVDDLCMKYFVEAGAMAVRRVKKIDLKRIARATGGKLKMRSCIFVAIICFKYVKEHF